MSENSTSLSRPLPARRESRVAAGVRGWFARHPGLGFSLALLAFVAVASTWLVFPYYMEGRKVLTAVGGEVQTERRTKAAAVTRLLSRVAPGPGEADVDVLYATQAYFEAADRARAVAKYRPDRYLIFMVVEATHTQDLPGKPPRARLIVDGVSYQPADRDGPGKVVHHRVTSFRFAKRDGAGKLIVTDHTRLIELSLESQWDPAETPRRATWQLPLEMPAQGTGDSVFSPILVLALSAGLLSAVLTPCLLQLIVIFLVTITGLGVGELTRAESLDGQTQKRVLLTALAFVGGFMVFYSATGALIGHAGKEAQLLFAEWSRPASVAAGLVVIALGLWVGIKARAPIACRLTLPAGIARFDGAGFIRSALIAFGFSLGCMACFGGAIIATLLVYVGALGSAAIGAAVMFTFSLGIAIPFLLAALFLSRMMPLLHGIARYTPQIGFTSMIVIIAFGGVLLTDNFHALSDLIYPWLGLN